MTCCDIFRNVNEASSLSCPTLLIHGTQDDVVHCRNTAAIHASLTKAGRARVAEPYYVEGAGHNDIFEIDPQEYFRVVGNFLDTLRAAPKGATGGVGGGGAGRGYPPLQPPATAS
jgi:alpha-beta hydrolase superfamily lysophospholipase